MSVLCCGVAYSRDVKIHGKIIDEKKTAMEFVTVGISGTAIGTMSKADGSSAHLTMILFV